jgi:hypothetical protein
MDVEVDYHKALHTAARCATQLPDRQIDVAVSAPAAAIL